MRRVAVVAVLSALPLTLGLGASSAGALAQAPSRATSPVKPGIDWPARVDAARVAAAPVAPAVAGGVIDWP
ncbi:hypothetical protein ACFYM2_32045 [Streptomyces sp. NPDC006711]|uniref:hypothetical protein n=1 Tax=unclassified Streptomyces TaxID=2593676 RepID=UPI0033D0CCB0